MIHKYHITLFYIGLLIVRLCIADTASTAASYYCNRTNNGTPLVLDSSNVISLVSINSPYHKITGV